MARPVQQRPKKRIVLRHSGARTVFTPYRQPHQYLNIYAPVDALHSLLYWTLSANSERDGEKVGAGGA